MMNQSGQQLRATLDGRFVAVYNAEFDFRSCTGQLLGNAMRQCCPVFDGRAHSALADAEGALAVLRFMAVAETGAV